MTETSPSFLDTLQGLITSPAGILISVLAVYLLLQLVILPRMGIQT